VDFGRIFLSHAAVRPVAITNKSEQGEFDIIECKVTDERFQGTSLHALHAHSRAQGQPERTLFTRESGYLQGVSVDPAQAAIRNAL